MINKKKFLVYITGTVVVLSSILADAADAKVAKDKPELEKMHIGILAPHPNDANPKRRLKGSIYEKWLNAVKATGYNDAIVINTREIQLEGDNFILRKKSKADRVYSNEPAEPLTKINTLIIPDTWMHYGVAKSIEKFVENGGRVIAIGKAGYLDGQFFLTKALQAGKHNLNVPIFYTYYCENNPNYIREKIKYALGHGADGFSFFNYYDFAAKPLTNSAKKEWFSNFPVDTTNPGLKKIFSQSLSWKTKDMPGLYGNPDFPQSVYLWNSYLIENGAEKIIAKLKELSVNVVVLDVFKAFGHPDKFPMIYKSKLFDELYKDSDKVSAKPEVFNEFYKLCKKNNIAIWAWGNAHYDNWPYDIKKPGFMIDAEGKESKIHCLVTGREWIELQINIYSEFAALYPDIVVYGPDEPHIDSKYCFCQECKKLFKQRYGRELDAAEKDSPEHMEFLENIMAEYYFKPLMNALNKVNPYIRLAMMLWSEYELSAVNPQKLSDLGVSIWMSENSNPPYYSEGMYYDVESSHFYLNTEHIGSHRVSWFNFDSLVLEKKDSSLLNSVFLDFPCGSRGVKLDVFNGAQVHAWMKNAEGNRYPAVVTANAGRTVYLSFDPFIDKLPEENGKIIVKNTLKWLDEHPFLMAVSE